MRLQVLLVQATFIPSIFGQLHDAAKVAGLTYFGTETESVSFADQPYQAVLKNTSEFGQITPGNSMKWDSIEPQPGKFSFTGGDAIASLAKANSQLLRCHTLVWHQQLPTWVTNGTWTKETLTAALKNHITTEVTHYKGQCYAWDVVNEALNDNGTFRNDVFFQVLGQDYIKLAFETAAAADPNAKLYYNDFGTEFPGAKSTAAQGIIKSLKTAGVKVDGVGFQAHFVVGDTPSKAAQIANMNAFTSLGVEVAITELDIRMKLPSTEALVAQQKTDYQTTTAACVATTGCVGVTVWDFDDKYSWIPSTFPGTGDGTLFDDSVTRKQAYFGALSGLVVASGNSSNSTGTSQSYTPTVITPSTNSNTTVTPPLLKVPTSPASSLSISGFTVFVVSLIFAAALL